MCNSVVLLDGKKWMRNSFARISHVVIEFESYAFIYFFASLKSEKKKRVSLT